MIQYQHAERARLRPAEALVWTRSVRPEQPSTIGIDGFVYGSTGAANRTLWRSGDGMQTIEEGPTLDFLPFWFSRTSSGHVVISRDWANDTAAIYHSTTFAGPYESVQTLKAVGSISIGTPVPLPNGNTLLLVGEYHGSIGPTRDLYKSEDGGLTWSVMRSSPTIVDGAVVSHWHCAEYDRGRIWAAHGDGSNRWFGYSDDLGSTWATIEEGASNVYRPPTAIAPLGPSADGWRRRIALGPDSLAPVSVDSMDAVGHKFRKADLLISNAYSAAYQFAIGPKAGTPGGNVCYLTMPPSGSGSDRLWVAATGDGGASWHAVVDRALGGDVISWGVIGPDRVGLLYSRGTNGGNSYVDIAPALAWVP